MTFSMLVAARLNVEMRRQPHHRVYRNPRFTAFPRSLAKAIASSASSWFEDLRDFPFEPFSSSRFTSVKTWTLRDPSHASRMCRYRTNVLSVLQVSRFHKNNALTVEPDCTSRTVQIEGTVNAVILYFTVNWISILTVRVSVASTVGSGLNSDDSQTPRQLQRSQAPRRPRSSAVVPETRLRGFEDLTTYNYNC